MDVRNVARAAYLLAFVLLGQDSHDARTLLKETAAVLKQHKTYVIEQRTLIDMSGATVARMEMLAKMAASAPGRMRTETSGQVGGALIVSDGENTWVYLAPLKQYMKTAAATGPEALVKTLVPGMGEVFDKLKSKDPYASAKLAGEDSVDVGGKKIDCYLVETTLDKISMPGSMTMTDTSMKFWIDKASKLTLKTAITASMEGPGMASPMHMNLEITVTSRKFDEPLPDSLFSFTPPEGAKEVHEFALPGMLKTDLAGKAAADFNWKSLDAKQYSLADLRGKVILIDFWATWCAPCRKDLPFLEKLHQEFKGKGLVVLGLDVGEDEATVTKFLKTTKLSYPILLTDVTDVAEKYSVTAYPTIVLIDREGKIALDHVGAGGEKELRESLAKLGIETTPAVRKPE